MKTVVLVFVVLLLISCSAKKSPSPNNNTALYFPNAQEWATTDPVSLNWNASKINELYTLLESNNTRGFIVLKNGKIVLEKYWGKDILQVQNFDKTKQWYWASAGKTLTAALVGLAEEDKFLDLTDKTSKYLGPGWTTMSKDKEDLITVMNQLTMTSGLDDGVANSGSFEPANLKYKADAGTRWAYHNAPYTLLDKVISSATKQDFDAYFDIKLKDKIGMDGQWRWVNNDHVFFSTTRSMARYGLLILNSGVWDGKTIINKNFVDAMVKPSQNINLSYGYLWWLNGKSSYRLPSSQVTFPGSFATNAPTDMVAGLGKNGQFLCVIPSQNLVVIRMGESPDNDELGVVFLDKMWKILNQVVVGK